MLVEEAVCSGARQSAACKAIGLTARTLQRWTDSQDDERRGPSREPKNRLSPSERERIVAVATSPEFRDSSPKQIVPALADRGIYYASESTFYRVLHAAELQRHRGHSRKPVSRPGEFVATGPWQVASWDITYLRSFVRGEFFRLYLVEDVWSRKILGWAVHEQESSELAAQLIQDIRRESGRELTGWVLHSDNGGPMRGATMLATMQRLGVVPSFSRPRVSDDNPYSESLFRTLKYCPEYPRDGFSSLDAARAWVARFVDWYNNEHHHSSIGYVTPAARHDGRDIALLEARRALYERARAKHPERWSGKTRDFTRPESVTLNPSRGRDAS
jgi:putative transposase